MLKSLSSSASNSRSGPSTSCSVKSLRCPLILGHNSIHTTLIAPCQYAFATCFRLHQTAKRPYFSRADSAWWSLVTESRFLVESIGLSYLLGFRGPTSIPFVTYSFFCWPTPSSTSIYAVLVWNFLKQYYHTEKFIFSFLPIQPPRLPLSCLLNSVLCSWIFCHNFIFSTLIAPGLNALTNSFCLHQVAKSTYFSVLTLFANPLSLIARIQSNQLAYRTCWNFLAAPPSCLSHFEYSTP